VVRQHFWTDRFHEARCGLVSPSGSATPPRHIPHSTLSAPKPSQRLSAESPSHDAIPRPPLREAGPATQRLREGSGRVAVLESRIEGSRIRSDTPALRTGLPCPQILPRPITIFPRIPLLRSGFFCCRGVGETGSGNEGDGVRERFPRETGSGNDFRILRETGQGTISEYSPSIRLQIRPSQACPPSPPPGKGSTPLGLGRRNGYRGNAGFLLA
jgi:hypothetical protein